MRWEDVKSYDDIYPDSSKAAAGEISASAVHKCEFLRRNGRHFRYCGLKTTKHDAPPTPDSPVYAAICTEDALRQYCHDPKGIHCPDFAEKARWRTQRNEQELCFICQESGIEYIEPEMTLSQERYLKHTDHAKILGRNYPIGRFEDHGVPTKMPYTIRYGERIPIICAASVVVKIAPDRKSYILITEGKEGSGLLRLDKNKYDLPGGAVENGELFEVAARREFLEEVGLLPEITGLVGLVERLSENSRLIWKAVFAGRLTDFLGGLIKEDSAERSMLTADDIRLFCQKGRLKSPDITLLVNRAEKGMIMDTRLLGTEQSMIRMGWD